MALKQLQLLLLLPNLAACSGVGHCPDDPDLDICGPTSKEAAASTTAPTPATSASPSVAKIESTEASSAILQAGSARGPVLMLMILSSMRSSQGGDMLSLPLMLASMAVGGTATIATADSTAPTCDNVIEAYKGAGCCGADDKATRKVEGIDIFRAGCESKVVTSTSSGPITGGTLYVYDASAGAKAWKTFPDGKQYVDLAQSSIAAGCVPKHKPHMVLPSPDGKYTAVTYTGDQDFSIIKNDEYSVKYCPTVDFLKPHVFGGATHTGAWHTKDNFLLLDMTGCVDGVCGGGVYKFSLQYDASGIMTGTKFESALGVSGVKAARNTSATKPIALGNNPSGDYKHLFFVTDAKGAGSVMNADTMQWEKHFPKSEFGNCVGGGLWVEPHPRDPAIVLVQYGQQGDAEKPGYNCLFKVNMQTLELSKVVELRQNIDAHGMQFCEPTSGDLTVLNTNRQDATLDVIKYDDGAVLLEGYKLNTEVFDKMDAKFLRAPDAKGGEMTMTETRVTDKLQPDVAYLHGEHLFLAARGPKPVSAVKAQNYYKNAHPGAMALKIDKATCLPAKDQSDAMILTTMERSPQITSDVHSLWGIGNEIWVVDQAGTGSVQTYTVYSSCAAMGVAADKIHPDPPTPTP